jgi:hypothetical protein
LLGNDRERQERTFFDNLSRYLQLQEILPKKWLKGQTSFGLLVKKTCQTQSLDATGISGRLIHQILQVELIPGRSCRPCNQAAQEVG